VVSRGLKEAASPPLISWRAAQGTGPSLRSQGCCASRWRATACGRPFLTGLTDGSLPHGTFAFYVVQDALYLRQYAQALAAVASRAPDAAGTEMFARHAADAVAVEKALHESLLADLGIDPASASAAEPAPTNLAYTSYLLAAIYGGSYADGIGAVLPCYWIYWEVGKELQRHGSPDPRCQRWIDTYGGEEFAEAVRAVLAVADELGPVRAPREREGVHQPALPGNQPLRMDVLGHGVPETDLAHLTSPEQYTSRSADRRIAQVHQRARMTGSVRNHCAAPKRHRRAERRISVASRQPRLITERSHESMPSRRPIAEYLIWLGPLVLALDEYRSLISERPRLRPRCC
jgi:thiaminase/transcriptional activator TenA